LGFFCIFPQKVQSRISSYSPGSIFYQSLYPFERIVENSSLPVPYGHDRGDGRATQLDWFAVFAAHQLVVVESLRWLVRCRLNCFLERRLPGLAPAGKTLAKHADRTEFHRSRKLITAARASALGLRFQGTNRSSAAI
jgi:hypothetical protein